MSQLNAPRYRCGFFGGKFMPPHLGHIDCILRCASECERLYVVLMHHGEQENEIRANYSGAFPKELLDVGVREAALRAELRPFENVEVVSYDCREADGRAAREGLHPWTYECQDMVRLLGRFDVAYCSEPEYAENFRRFYPWAEAVVLDEGRERFPIRATDLRAMGFARAYPHLPRAYQQLVNRRVLVTGPESCGKTTLVRKLACALGTTYTEEQGRLACERFGVAAPLPSLYPSFVHAQKEAERRAVEGANMVAICDTDAIVTAFYLELYEGRRLELAYETARCTSWDKVLFVEPTVPWVDDGYRTSGAEDERLRQARRLRRMYEEVGYELVTLDGDYRQNYERALAEVRELLGLRGGMRGEVA